MQSRIKMARLPDGLINMCHHDALINMCHHDGTSICHHVPPMCHHVLPMCHHLAITCHQCAITCHHVAITCHHVAIMWPSLHMSPSTARDAATRPEVVLAWPPSMPQHSGCPIRAIASLASSSFLSRSTSTSSSMCLSEFLPSSAVTI